MIRKLLLAVALVAVPSIIFAQAPRPSERGSYYTNPNTGKSGAEVMTSDVVTTATSVTSNTLIVNLANTPLAQSGGRPYASQGFIVYNVGSTAVEWLITGAPQTTATGGLTASGANYTVPVATTGYSKFFKNDEIWFYDPTTKAVQCKVQLVEKIAPATFLVAYLGGTVGTPASGSILGYKNAYAVPTGTGHVLNGNANTGPYPIVVSPSNSQLVFARIGGSGTASIRVLQMR